jgi:hypothetical protein
VAARAGGAPPLLGLNVISDVMTIMPSMLMTTDDVTDRQSGPRRPS